MYSDKSSGLNAMGMGLHSSKGTAHKLHFAHNVLFVPMGLSFLWQKRAVTVEHCTVALTYMPELA